MSKTIHLITGLNVGGAETFLYNYLRALPPDVAADHVVVSMTGAGVYGSQLLDAGVSVVCLNFSLSGSALLKSAFELLRLAFRGNYRVAFFWMYHPMLLSLIFCRSAKKVVWMVRRSLDGMERVKWTTRLTMRLCAFFSHFVPDTIVYNSQDGKVTHERYGYKADVSLVIQNGVNTEKFLPNAGLRGKKRVELGIPEDAFLVASVGRLEDIKGPDVLAKVIAALLSDHPEIHFLIVGRPSLQYNSDYFLSSLDESLHGQVHFLGQIPNVDQVLPAADVLVNCSYCEGFPNGVAEAMSSGVVPIVTDVGDSALLVGDPALVVSPGDSKAIAAILSGLYVERGGVLLQSRKAVDRVRQNFSFLAAVEKLNNLSRF